jgi:hypothetical protein
MKAARPCSAQSQKGLSPGSGDTSGGEAYIYKFRLLPKAIDDFTDQFPPNTKPRKNALVFRKDFFGDKPSEGPTF